VPTMTLGEIREAAGAELAGDENLRITDIITDSRRIVPGVLFVALKGEKFNGEDFAREAAQKGAAAVMVSRACPTEKIDGLGAALLKADDCLTAYQQIARAWRERFDLPLIAVTGSNGKTTTKDITAAILSARGNVLKTKANFNNEIGLPLTLLGLNESHNYAVTEIGMRGLGQIAALAKIAEPTVGIVTNVGETHLELLGSIDNIARAKGELAEAIPSGGKLILNADDVRVAAMAEKARRDVEVVTYGIDCPADVRGGGIRVENGVTKFMVLYRNERHDYLLPLVGRHNVYDALAGMAAAFSLGLNPDEVREGLQNLERSAMRFDMQNRGKYKIVNDAYNASPLSMRAAIETLAQLAPGRKIAVLGDMLELGDDAAKLHTEVGRHLGEQKFNALVTYGELAKHIAEGAKSAGVSEVYTADSHESAAEILQRIMREQDTILFKGSRGMKMEKIIGLIDWERE